MQIRSFSSVSPPNSSWLITRRNSRFIPSLNPKAFYDACNSIIQSLQKELEDDEITSDERERIEDKLIKVAQMIGEKDSENKGFLLKCLGIGALVITVVGGAAAAILGSNTQISQNDDYDDDNDDIV